MKRISIFLFLVFSSTFCLAQGNLESLEKELQAHFDASDLPGFSVALVDQNGILFQQAFGFADQENPKEFTTKSILNMGSVSKTMVGLALAKTIEEGKISMDLPINDFLPFEVQNPYFKDDPILIKHLANHSSTITDTKHYGQTYVLDDSFVKNGNINEDFLGFIQSHEKVSLQDFLYSILSKDGKRYAKKNFLKAKPGLENEYSNLNAALLGLIIEIVNESTLEDFSRSNIFEPLGLKFTSWKLNPVNRPLLARRYFPAGFEVPAYSLITYPDGGLYSNTEDMAIYLSEMIKAYSGVSKYLKPEFAQLMLPGDSDESRAFWGMGQESRNIGHGGSDPGIQTDIQFNADRKIGRVILCNVNAEDNEKLWEQYRGIHEILARYELRFSEE